MRSIIHTMKRDATAAFQAGVNAANPQYALQAAFQTHPITVPKTGKIHAIALGKAAVAMLGYTLQTLKDCKIATAIAVTNDENATPLEGAQVFASAHPVPDERGLLAGQKIMHALSQTQTDDLVICLISGGASALLPAPIAGISLADKIAVNKMLLGAGLDIHQMNLIRQSLSTLKGGGLLKCAHPATVQSYILSDVLDDDLRVIGSGPSIGAIGSITQARKLLQDCDLFDRLAPNVQRALQRPDTPLLQADGFLIGSNQHSLHAMADRANALPCQQPLIGDVKDAARHVVQQVIKAGAGCRLAFGGETTVQLRGNGQGGRNQELALRIMQQATVAGLSEPWVVLAAGTDGRDGPTDAAGALLSHESMAALQNAGVEFNEMLDNNDSYHVLDAINAHVKTGATGTNVADLTLFLRG